MLLLRCLTMCSDNLCIQDLVSNNGKGKGKVFPKESWRLRGRMKCWASILTLKFCKNRTAGLLMLIVDRNSTPTPPPEENSLVLS